ncbi:hypothetical protein B0H14DRAFT_2565545 [Mycena olivaceomarginata]|nr:hypothetical protein B0H14DRAFT_2565545 [Mycena olivaceomarginata]
MTARELARLVRDWQRDVTSTVTWRTTFVVVDAACSERIKPLSRAPLLPCSRAHPWFPGPAPRIPSMHPKQISLSLATNGTAMRSPCSSPSSRSFTWPRRSCVLMLLCQACCSLHIDTLALHQCHPPDLRTTLSYAPGLEAAGVPRAELWAVRDGAALWFGARYGAGACGPYFRSCGRSGRCLTIRGAEHVGAARQPERRGRTLQSTVSPHRRPRLGCRRRAGERVGWGRDPRGAVPASRGLWDRGGGDRAFFGLHEQAESLLRREALPRLRDSRDMSEGSDCMWCWLAFGAHGATFGRAYWRIVATVACG